MEAYELHLPPVRPQRSSGGKFLKGLTPHNKGKCWDDWMPKRKQKKIIRITTVYLRKCRPKTRPDNFERCRKEVIGVIDDGKLVRFKCLKEAAEFCNGDYKNVSRCCRLNQSNRKNLYTGAINTNHRYKGVRFYFANDINLFKSLESHG